MKRLAVFLVCGALCAAFRPPAADRAVARGQNGAAILPGGRVVQPLGGQLPTGPGTFSLALSPSRHTILSANIGPERASLTVAEQDIRNNQWFIHNFFTSAPGNVDDDFHTLAPGIVFASDRLAWVSEGDSGRVRLIDVGSGTRRKVLDLDAGGVHDSYSGALAFDSTRSLLFVLDQAHFRVVIFDTHRGAQISSIQTGLLPFTLSLAPDRQHLWVTNVGRYRYHTLSAPRAFPELGFPPSGNEAAPETGSVMSIDVTDPEHPKVTGKVTLGERFGAPSGLLVRSDAVYLSDAHNDAIYVIDPVDLKVLGSIRLQVPGLEDLRGVMPTGLAWDDTHHWLLVAEAGINAVGVVDPAQGKMLGHVPTGWFPSAIAVRDNDWLVANAKGHGVGPTSIMLPDFAEFGTIQGRGSVSVIPIPALGDLAKRTQVVLAANGFLPVPSEVPPVLPPMHVVWIVKGDRSFDEVLGDLRLSGVQVNGEAKLAKYGADGFAKGGKSRFSLQHVDVTPNQHALATAFSFSDNFYADGATSAEGMHWIQGNYPDPQSFVSLTEAAAGVNSFRADDGAPGRLSAGTHSAILPEEWQTGAELWQYLEANKVSFRVFGAGFQVPGCTPGANSPSGIHILTDVPVSAPLLANLDREYPEANLAIADQTRAERFIRVMDAEYRQTGKPIPQLLVVHLPNDSAGPARPSEGYPYEASYVADNDLALGKIVDYLSHSPWWSSMTIFVTQSSAFGGVDHVDAHRAELLAVGPYCKRGYVSHRNANFPAVIKTLLELSGLGPLNLFDASAADLFDLMQAKPDPTPFTVHSVDERLFDAATVRTASR